MNIKLMVALMVVLSITTSAFGNSNQNCNLSCQLDAHNYNYISKTVSKSNFVKVVILNGNQQDLNKVCQLIIKQNMNGQVKVNNKVKNCNQG